MIAVECEEWRHADRAVVGCVVCELGKRQKVGPIVLKIVAVEAQVLFEGLVDALGLTITLRVESR